MPRALYLPRMENSIENIFNGLSASSDKDARISTHHIQSIVEYIQALADQNQLNEIRTTFQKMSSKLKTDDQAEIVYQCAKISTDNQWQAISKNFSASYVVYRDDVIATALYHKDLKALDRIPFESEMPNFTTRLEKIDAQWLKNNMSEIETALDVDFGDLRLINSMHRLIETGRHDVFQVLFENIPQEKRRYQMAFLQALKSHDTQASEYFLTPKTFKFYAGMETSLRYKNMRVLFKEAQGFDENIAMKMFQGFHDHGAIKSQLTLPDIEKMVHLRQRDFLKQFVDLGYIVRGNLAIDLSFICARNNEPEMQKLLLAPLDGNPYQQYDYSLREFSRAIRNDNLECVKIAHDTGLSTFHKNLIQHCASVEMYEYMTGIGYELPNDRRLMVTDSRPYSYKALIERQYLYRDLRADPLELNERDIQYLKGLTFANLRKVHSLPSGVRGRGMTLAAKSGRFDVVIAAALKHTHNAPFALNDLYKEDRNLKCRLIDVLIATEQAGAMFEPLLWRNRTEEMEKAWRAIPREEKSKYEKSYKNALNALKVKENLKTPSNTPLRRRISPK